MFSDIDNRPPRRSVDEFLEVAIRRGSAIRRRRRMLRTVPVVLVVAVSTVGVASLAAADRDRPSQVIAEKPVATTPITTEPSTTTTVVTTSPSLTTPVVAQPKKAPTSTTTAAPASCTSEDFEVVTRTARDTYRVGESVEIVSTVRNVSSHDCPMPYYRGHCVSDADKKGGICADVSIDVDPNAPVERIAAGATTEWVGSWNQRGCGWEPGDSGCQSQAPPGTYTVSVGWALAGTASSAPFMIVRD